VMPALVVEESLFRRLPGHAHIQTMRAV
jgi:hypothetical protein